ncbi:unnamed protein product [Didymodactylos carnosus]|uniref:Uncharacterized protein n=1 Tax=Didymodactylos carnosus TaxID=1234261 RepID=A0A813WSJ3_9BILA|nr:unnamed protein product [Didymodactylos carnosus]CAF0881355.1 unnamed protein product [Didymodactylos carnosus]CAF3650207.1 unnamed protein product [Didymodactylos carnosus]CAF3665007.1 unnamed protein product [Didymodactylos carnosus]
MASSNNSKQFQFKNRNAYPLPHFDSSNRPLNNHLISPSHLLLSQRSKSFERDLDQDSIPFSKATFASNRNAFSPPPPSSISSIKNNLTITAQEKTPVATLRVLFDTNDVTKVERSVVHENNQRTKLTHRSPPPPPTTVTSISNSISRTSAPSTITSISTVAKSTSIQTPFKTITTQTTTISRNRIFSLGSITGNSEENSVKSINQPTISTVEPKEEKKNGYASEKSSAFGFSRRISLNGGNNNHDIKKQLYENSDNNNEQSLQSITSPRRSVVDTDSEAARSFTEIREFFQKQQEQQQPPDRSSLLKSTDSSNSRTNSSLFSRRLSKPEIPSLTNIPIQNNDYQSSSTNNTTPNHTSLNSPRYVEHSSDSSFSDEEEDFDQKHNDSSNSDLTDKLCKCIEELWTTEKTYVNTLYVLSSKLPAEVKRSCGTDDQLVVQFNSTYKPLLGALQAIYKLHCDTILPKITSYVNKSKISQETANSNVWSVLRDNSQFISVLYKDYYVRISESQAKLDDLCKSHSSLNDAMLNVQTMMGSLYPMTQLNCPNQRLLRYILCMKTYMKYLDKKPKEYELTKSIHDELDRIACDCQEALTVSSVVLNDLNDRLDNKFECYKDQRKLLWCGPLKKQSPRTNREVAQRYIILFSDCMLVCNEISQKKLEIKKELSIKNMTIDENHSTNNNNNNNNNMPLTMVNTTSSLLTDLPQQQHQQCRFRVNAIEKSYEFIADDEKDKQIWIKKIEQAIDEYSKRITHIVPRESRSSITASSNSNLLGFRAPTWVNDVDVSRCQLCNTKFPSFNIVRINVSNKHHCRACGKAVCNSCSSKKLTLEYNKTLGESRVCDVCYTELATPTKHASFTASSARTQSQGVTRDPDRTILFSDFRYESKSIWMALQEDFILHIYGARLDKAEDFAIKLDTICDCLCDRETYTITIRETITSKPHVFVLDTTHQMTYFDAWCEAIEAARASTCPSWYTKKRDSSDSGVSTRS